MTDHYLEIRRGQLEPGYVPPPEPWQNRQLFEQLKRQPQPPSYRIQHFKADSREAALRKARDAAAAQGCDYTLFEDLPRSLAGRPACWMPAEQWGPAPNVNGLGGDHPPGERYVAPGGRTITLTHHQAGFVQRTEAGAAGGAQTQPAGGSATDTLPTRWAKAQVVAALDLGR